MKTRIAVIATLVAASVSTFALSENYRNTALTVAAPETEALTWYTTINDAHNASLQSGKPIFAFFTGSDWCGWCIKLQREVFAKPAFVEWAASNVILLELDFPRKKVMDPEIQKQNQSLQQALGVRGYPTVWILRTAYDPATNNMSLSAMGTLGYPSGATPGKEEVLFLENANKILATENK